MKDIYCDFCKKKIDEIPDTKGKIKWDKGYGKGLDFHVEISIHLMTGMDICGSCVSKAAEKALSDEETRKTLIKHLVDPPVYMP